MAYTSAVAPTLLALTFALLFLVATAQDCKLRFGMTSALTGSLSAEGTFLFRGTKVWEAAVKKAGGIKVGSKRCMPELVHYDDQSIGTRSVELYTKLIDEDNVDFLLGPYSSGLTILISKIAEERRRVLISGGSASTNVFVATNNFTFGVLSPAPNYQTSSINLAKLEGARSVAWFSQPDIFNYDCCSAVTPLAERLGMKVTGNVTLPAVATPDDVVGAMKTLAGANPDVLVACTYDALSAATMSAAKNMSYFAPAMMLNRASESQAILDTGDARAYYLAPVQWHHLLSYAGTVDVFDSAKGFAEAFENMWGEIPTDISAGGACAASMFQWAIEQTGSTDNEVLRDKLDGAAAFTFYGLVLFGDEGINSGKPMASIQYIGNLTRLLVTPLESAEILAIYPAPTWEERVYDDGWLKETSEIVIVSLDGVAFVLSVVFLVLTMVARKTNAMKASSPWFMVGFLLGTLFIYAAVPCWMLYVTDASCMALPWLFGVGFALSFGCLFAKTWRIHQIFTKKSLKVTEVSLKELGIFVGIVFLMEVVPILVWTVHEPLEAVVVVQDPDRPSKNYTQCEGDESITPIYISVLLVW
eukprot:CAMPEP_0177656914 /NCGR_PEP_ID=MMETSP0447-20121125/15867_1 /TAXON_ID=0 /ORGANISM="Stygamoeba regulata, Strain BSH-02190019" /LENGTH=586 /DNA_ID=CAMNT_0019161157 /DNA_START=204 /DNA_END=1961 /DNA_ORIENTATION=-